MNITYGSVCSGVEAASLAWEPLGWKPQWFSEIEEFPSAVLKHHWPQVLNLGDMTRIPDLCNFMDAAPDVLVGGCPCQAFSHAGKRLSLSDARGNLTITYIGIINALDQLRKKQGKRDTVIVYENVPGILSTPDNAFGCFVGGLVGADRPAQPSAPPEGKRGNAHWAWSAKAGHLVPRWPNAGWVIGPERAVAWRVMDAQWAGLAQRRRRVFLVGCSRASGIDPREILFEPQSVCRDTPPSREEGEGTTHDVAPCIGASGRGFERTGETRGQDPVIAVAGVFQQSSMKGKGIIGWEDVDLVKPCKTQQDGQMVVVFGGNNTSGPVDIAPALNANRGCHNPGDFEAGALCVTGARTHAVMTLAIRGRGDGANLEVREDGTANALRTPNGGRAGIGVGAVAVAATRSAGGCPNSNAPGRREKDDVNLVVSSGRGWWEEADVGATIRAQDSVTKADTLAVHAMQVRRLTPRECEKLQGMPRHHTLIPWKNKPAAYCPDGPRYKAIGNSMAVPCMRWIGERIELILGRNQ